MTTSLDVATWLVSRHGMQTMLTNLSLNKLCFFAQVEALRMDGRPLFADRIEAWRYGPVCPPVYHAYKRFGRNTITYAMTTPTTPNERETRVLDALWEHYGCLSTYDLVRLSHRRDGAWSKAWAQGEDTVISDDLILHSTDMSGFNPDGTFAASVKRVENHYRNTLRLLENS